MQAKIVICGLVLAVVSFDVSAQQLKKPRTATTMYRSTNEGDQTKETVTMAVDGVPYQLEMVNEKITGFYADGKQIPAEQYNQYNSIIKKIKAQLRLDKIQAKKDQEQASDDQKNSKLEYEKAAKDQEQAKLDQEQAQKDQQEAKLDQESAAKDQLQAKLDQENAAKDQEAAKRDQEESIKDQLAAKIDEEQAKQDQQQAKQFIGDLIKDGIVSDENHLQSVKLTSKELVVNDKKQPDSIFEKYKAKYSKFADRNFFYGNSEKGKKTMQLHR